MEFMVFGAVIMGSLGFFMAVFLSMANKEFRVEEDPRIDLVENLLPSANCGACGQPGCRAFAEGVVMGKFEVTGCPVGDEAMVAAIAKIMGVEAGGFIKRVAKVLCRGGLREAKRDSVYYGIAKCSTAAQAGGGEKACKHSCIGYADCVAVCKFDAMWMNHNGLPVVDEDACTSCGKCAEVCPRNIIELHSRDVKVHVYCRNRDTAKTAKANCSVACIGCGICAKADPENIFMENNLAVIRYNNDQYTGAEECTAKCPTKCIVYDLDPSVVSLK